MSRVLQNLPRRQAGVAKPFACAAPQARETAIWKQLHIIRDDYLKKQANVIGE